MVGAIGSGGGRAWLGPALGLGLALGFGGGRALVAEVLTTQGPHKRLVRGRGRGRTGCRSRS